MAYDQIPHKVWSEGSISVVDYGCGQCIAEMVLSDFLKSQFSNVLDITEFERHDIASILNSDMSHNNILVCVSPFYQENGRGALMDEFSDMLRGMRCEYKFEKHTDEWKNPFSCQIRIFVSNYY